MVVAIEAVRESVDHLEMAMMNQYGDRLKVRCMMEGKGGVGKSFKAN